MLELRGVTKRVGAETHIDDVSLSFAPGTLNILLGPTLSGKNQPHAIDGRPRCAGGGPHHF
jgi:ABC-type sugar transport system ATPase subunit